MDADSREGVELYSGLCEFTVFDRNGEEVGKVARTSMDDACLLVETGGLLRKKELAIHHSAVEDVDLDAQTITVRATRGQVEQAPEYHNLDEHSSERAERYYSQLH